MFSFSRAKCPRRLKSSFNILALYVAANVKHASSKQSSIFCILLLSSTEILIIIIIIIFAIPCIFLLHSSVDVDYVVQKSWQHFLGVM
jgi:hypothetical protein